MLLFSPPLSLLSCCIFCHYFSLQPAFLIWTAAAENPAAEEARLAANRQQYADAKKQYDNSRETVSHTGEGTVCTQWVCAEVQL